MSGENVVGHTEFFYAAKKTVAILQTVAHFCIFDTGVKFSLILGFCAPRGYMMHFSQSQILECRLTKIINAAVMQVDAILSVK